jgi:putative sterol carrier protein
MATQVEMREALNDYIAQAQKSAKIQQAFRGWNCVIYFEVSDIQAGFTMTIQGGQATLAEGVHEAPDLIVRGTSEDLTNIFWCDENPASNYMQGAIKIQGSQENTMRLDAMSLLIYLEAKNAR